MGTACLVAAVVPRASLWPSVAQPGVTMKVQDAVCLVTGSAQGLGKAFAVRLPTAGARVCISDVREEGGLATLKELREKFGENIVKQRMKKQPKKGTIVNTASMAGIMTGFAEDALPYFVSKHGVVTLTRTLNASFQESGVEVKALCPAWADTEIVSGVSGDERKAVVNKIVAKHGGLMTVEYVAEGFYSLLTDCPRGSVLGAVR